MLQTPKMPREELVTNPFGQICCPPGWSGVFSCQGICRCYYPAPRPFPAPTLPAGSLTRLEVSESPFYSRGSRACRWGGWLATLGLHPQPAPSVRETAEQLVGARRAQNARSQRGAARCFFRLSNHQFPSPLGSRLGSARPADIWL